MLYSAQLLNLHVSIRGKIVGIILALHAGKSRVRIPGGTKKKFCSWLFTWPTQTRGVEMSSYVLSASRELRVIVTSVATWMSYYTLHK